MSRYDLNEVLKARTASREEQQQNSGEVKLVLARDGSVSGNHCKIYEMSNRLVIMDLGSRNHTFLNGMMVQQPTEIPLWGQIQVGKSVFRVAAVDKV